MTKYVAGFLFNPDLSKVALIKKNKPDWQKDKLNAIGGKVEDGESSFTAMTREFWEEADIKITDWEFFCKMSGEDWEVDFFRSCGDYKIRSVESEEVNWYDIKEINNLPVIQNLKWLVPLAMSQDKIETIAKYV